MARAMKNSGIEWIGEIPENWQVVRGKTVFRQRNEKGNDVCLQLLSPTQKYGVIPQAEYEQLSGMKAVKLDVSADYSQLKTIHAGDFCISLRSFQGGFEYSQHEGAVSPAYQVFYPHIECDDGYFKYLFKDRTFIDKMNSYTLSLRDGKNIAFSDFANTYIPFPPIDEQTRIAAFLDAECAQIDAVIEQTRASIEEYKKLKRSVITHTVTKGIRPGRKMKDSGVNWIDSIPEEWSMERGKGLFIEVDNRSEDGTEELLTVSQYTGITPRSQKNVNMFEAETLEGYKICEIGDIAANTMWLWAGAIGVSRYRGVISPSYNIYRQKSNSFDPIYLDYLLRAAPLVQHYESLSTGIRASRLRLYPQQFLSIRYPVPPMNEQKEIVSFLKEKIDGLDLLIQKKEQYLAEIESYKKSLIFEYVTGKKEVR